MMDSRLLDFCETDTQRERVAAAISLGVIPAAKKLGVDRRSLQRLLANLRLKASVRGYSPSEGLDHPTTAAYIVKGVSTLYSASGEVSQRWVKTEIDPDAREALFRESIEALKDEIPRADPQPQPTQARTDLLNCFVITDLHIGALAWPEETRGDPWDTDIAEETLFKWFEAAINAAPRADHAVFAQLGDFAHYDSLTSITPTSGHVLDSDTRFQRLVRVVIRVIRRVVALLLSRHERVTVLMSEGNHDLSLSAAMREFLSVFYETEPRVTVDTSPDPYYCVEHGKTALFFHHGHLSKFDKVDRVFAAKFREVFGRTQHAFAHMGHYHHRKELESALMVVTQHRTLAASDAYASRGGWLSGRDARVITYHSEFGEVGSVTVSPAMLRAKA